MTLSCLISVQSFSVFISFDGCIHVSTRTIISMFFSFINISSTPLFYYHDLIFHKMSFRFPILSVLILWWNFIFSTFWSPLFGLFYIFYSFIYNSSFRVVEDIPLFFSYSFSFLFFLDFPSVPFSFYLLPLSSFGIFSNVFFGQSFYKWIVRFLLLIFILLSDVVILILFLFMVFIFFISIGMPPLKFLYLFV